MSGTLPDRCYSSEEILSEMEKQKSRSKNWLKNLIILFISLFIFFRIGLLKICLNDLLIIILVLIVHEGGHFMGMRFFGYRNVHMLFIPFLGAAVSGESQKVATYKQAIVTLLGPLPGIFIGIILLVVHLKTNTPIYCQLARMFFLINGFNLLPFFPLDGGRFLQETLFSRNPYVELFSRLLAALALVAGAYVLGTWILGLLGVISLLSVHSAFKAAKISNELRQDFTMGDKIDTETIPPEMAERIIKNIYRRIGERLTVKTVASFTQQIWKRMHLRSLRVPVALGFLGVYLLCLCLSLLSLGAAVVISLSDQNTIFEKKILEYLEPDGGTAQKEQFYILGKLTAETEVAADGLLYHGKAIKYHQDGSISREGTWCHGKKDGEWKYYDKQGNLIRVRIFDKGKFIVCKEWDGNRWVEKGLEDLPASEQKRRMRHGEGPPLGPKLPKKTSAVTNQ